MSRIRRYDVGPDTATAGPENDGGSLAGNESSDASSTRADSSLALWFHRVRADGSSAIATPAPAATAINPHIMFFDIIMRIHVAERVPTA
jgi:hypothetical protein